MSKSRPTHFSPPSADLCVVTAGWYIEQLEELVRDAESNAKEDQQNAEEYGNDERSKYEGRVETHQHYKAVVERILAGLTFSEDLQRRLTDGNTLLETGTLYVNGSCLGPAERDPSSGMVSSGPQVTRRAATLGFIAVVRVDPSPMNRKRWELTLACGHTLWVTSAKRPSRKTSKCATCAKEG